MISVWRRGPNAPPQPRSTEVLSKLYEILSLPVSPSLSLSLSLPPGWEESSQAEAEKWGERERGVLFVK